MSPTSQRESVDRFLASNYSPSGYRAQLMVGHPVDELFETAAREVVIAAGLDPARRVNLLQPRPGEAALRERDVVEFFDRYGHEYCAALMPALEGWDIATITDAALRSGCRVLWKRSTSDLDLLVTGDDLSIS